MQPGNRWFNTVRPIALRVQFFNCRAMHKSKLYLDHNQAKLAQNINRVGQTRNLNIPRRL